MRVKRRDFLKLAGVLGTGAVYDLYTADLRSIFAQVIDGKKHVIWLQGSGDSGCTVSLLQGVNPDLVDVINDFRLAIDFHPTIMIPSGTEAMDVLLSLFKGKAKLDILIIEGAIPSAHFCTVGESRNKPVPFMDLVRNLGKKAQNVVAIGTCASYGGISASSPNPTDAQGVTSILPSKKVINIPGCPAHPDWIVLTLATLLNERSLRLDEHRRPVQFFDEDIHDDCPYEDFYEDDRFARNFSDPGCLYQLGCKGKRTHGDCNTRLWNNRTSWCISGHRMGHSELYHSGAPCIGCTEPGFPDPPFSPFFSNQGGEHDDEDDS